MAKGKFKFQELSQILITKLILLYKRKYYVAYALLNRIFI